MELPQDIIGYLEKFIKPKRFSLINKFCRDFYFRKYGLSVLLNTDYPDTPLFDKYNVKIIDMKNIQDDHLETLIDSITFRQKVTQILCKKYINSSRYNMLRKIFPKLVKFESAISDYKNITDLMPLEGTTVHIIIQSSIYQSPLDIDTIQKLVATGYKISCSANQPINLLKDISDSVLYLAMHHHGSKVVDINKFPNLKVLTILPRIDLDSFISDIIEHPSIRLIYGINNPIIKTISKKNGNIAQLRSNIWCDRNNNILDQSMYDRVKQNYNSIAINTSILADKLIKYEMGTHIVKKMTINISGSYIDRENILSMLELFNVAIITGCAQLQSWLTIAKSHKIKSKTWGLVYKLYIRKGKLSITIR